MNRLRWWTLSVILTSLLACASGCAGRRVVLVPPGEPVQLAESVRAHVYVKVEGRRERSRNRVLLPEGWWCLPDPSDEKN